MQTRGEELCFPPVYSASARALVLGSYPSPKSFALGFYYGHPQNRFWPLLALLTGKSLPQTIAEKQQLILSSGLALWDVLSTCRILGAADATITSPVPNDIPDLVKKTQIEAVFCNGAAAHKYYRRYCETATGIPAFCLPSTSPANAACSLQKLVEAWQPLTKYILK